MEEQASRLLQLHDVLFSYANEFLRALPAVLIALVVLGIFIAVSTLAKTLVAKLSRRVTDDRSLQSLFGQITKVAVIVAGIFAAAAVVFPGLSAGHLISVLGLSSVAIGFAFQDIFQNFLAGVLILSQRPFHIGDQIESNELEGTVQHISIRHTVIKTYDGQRIIIPNAQIFTNPITVRTAYTQRRTTFSAGIAYDEDIEQARGVIKEALAGCEAVLDDPAPEIYVSEHADSAVNFDVRFWSEPEMAAVWSARDQVGTAVKYALDDAGIEIPYPYRTVEFHDLTERQSDAKAAE